MIKRLTQFYDEHSFKKWFVHMETQNYLKKKKKILDCPYIVLIRGQFDKKAFWFLNKPSKQKIFKFPTVCCCDDIFFQLQSLNNHFFIFGCNKLSLNGDKSGEYVAWCINNPFCFLFYYSVYTEYIDKQSYLILKKTFHI